MPLALRGWLIRPSCIIRAYQTAGSKNAHNVSGHRLDGVLCALSIAANPQDQQPGRIGVLMLVDIVIGTMLGIATPQDFGKIGQLIATIALVALH